MEPEDKEQEQEQEQEKDQFDKASKESWEKGINPKDLIGSKKLPLSLVPPSAIMGLSLALKEGAGKYGPYNWRDIPIRESIYLEACLGHINALIDGEDVDEDSGLWHVYKAQACLAIIADAYLSNTLIDDRHTKKRLHRGGFSRDPSKVFGDLDRIKHLIEQPVRESSIGTQPTKPAAETEVETEVKLDEESVWHSVLIDSKGFDRGLVRFNAKPLGDGYVFSFVDPDSTFCNTTGKFLKFTDYKSRILLPLEGLPDWALKQLTDRVWPVG